MRIPSARLIRVVSLHKTATSAHLLRSCSRGLIGGWSCALVAPPLGSVQVNGTSDALFTAGMRRNSKYRFWLLVTRPETDAVAQRAGGCPSCNMQFRTLLPSVRTLVQLSATSKPPYNSPRRLLIKNTAGKLKIEVKKIKRWLTINSSLAPCLQLQITFVSIAAL